MNEDPTTIAIQRFLDALPEAANTCVGGSMTWPAA